MEKKELMEILDEVFFCPGHTDARYIKGWTDAFVAIGRRLDGAFMPGGKPEGQAHDPVNHPGHYTEGHKIEVIQFLEDWMLPFHLANTVKYICRAGRKDPGKTVEDLKKGQWYLNRYIELLEKGGAE